mmetsp:Transcript_67196/g.132540  ORF Transcript_67196/g.132540 Transcript_67196/m.132540 type:complete len:234 (-) Transcript_67196:3-704(-)
MPAIEPAVITRFWFTGLKLRSTSSASLGNQRLFAAMNISSSSFEAGFVSLLDVSTAAGSSCSFSLACRTRQCTTATGLRQPLMVPAAMTRFLSTGFKARNASWASSVINGRLSLINLSNSSGVAGRGARAAAATAASWKAAGTELNSLSDIPRNRVLIAAIESRQPLNDPCDTTLLASRGETERSNCSASADSHSRLLATKSSTFAAIGFTKLGQLKPFHCTAACKTGGAQAA